jgi:hypothetical protein
MTAVAEDEKKNNSLKRLDEVGGQRVYELLGR